MKNNLRLKTSLIKRINRNTGNIKEVKKIIIYA